MGLYSPVGNLDLFLEEYVKNCPQMLHASQNLRISTRSVPGAPLGYIEQYVIDNFRVVPMEKFLNGHVLFLFFENKCSVIIKIIAKLRKEKHERKAGSDSVEAKLRDSLKKVRRNHEDWRRN